mmetsp:Transcript_12353/g.39304  ORF Transcript_12353/g.39304 Transcript_12353/m.39304 type:complete len:362 (-) Transcript_12353:304-1389(-)
MHSPTSGAAAASRACTSLARACRDTTITWRRCARGSSSSAETACPREETRAGGEPRRRPRRRRRLERRGGRAPGKRLGGVVAHGARRRRARRPRRRRALWHRRRRGHERRRRPGRRRQRRPHRDRHGPRLPLPERGRDRASHGRGLRDAASRQSASETRRARLRPRRLCRALPTQVRRSRASRRHAQVMAHSPRPRRLADAQSPGAEPARRRPRRASRRRRPPARGQDQPPHAALRLATPRLPRRLERTLFQDSAPRRRRRRLLSSRRRLRQSPQVRLVLERARRRPRPHIPRRHPPLSPGCPRPRRPTLRRRAVDSRRSRLRRTRRAPAPRRCRQRPPLHQIHARHDRRHPSAPQRLTPR